MPFKEKQHLHPRIKNTFTKENTFLDNIKKYMFLSSEARGDLVTHRNLQDGELQYCGLRVNITRELGF